MGCPLYMYFVINVQEQGGRYEAISSITVGMISDLTKGSVSYTGWIFFIPNLVVEEV